MNKNKPNKMLNNISTNLKVIGVSDGTCNQINSLMLNSNNKCDMGVSDANQANANSNNKYLEPFTNNNINGSNINQYIGIIFLFLILILFIRMNILDYKIIKNIK
jgi:hypothetical protein